MVRQTLFTSALLISTALFAAPALAQGTIRVAMTAGDIPLTHGQPDQAFEGLRFTGYTMYDPLVTWDQSDGSKPSGIIPGLATEWKVDDKDKTRWVFKLRPGVKFHDGSAFNADAVVWNVRKVLDREAPQYDPRQAGSTTPRMPSLRRAEKIDDLTVALYTSEPESLLPINLTNLFMASPTKWEELRKTQPTGEATWNAFAAAPSGTGPFRLTKFIPRQRAEMERFDGYWGEKAKADKIVLLPIPEANTRVSALLSGQVDWVEAPAPDSVPELKSAGFAITQKITPHVWPWQPCFAARSPMSDIRVRKALNLAIDRDGLKELLGGLMEPATGTVEKGHPWRGSPAFEIKTDKEAAKKLLAEAGYGPGKPLKLKVQISSSGSGQMQPLPMNEFIQQDLRKVGVEVTFDVIDYSTLFVNWRKGCEDAGARGADALNASHATMDPFFGMLRFYDSKMAPPVSNNWGSFSDPKFDQMVKDVHNAFDPVERDAALAKLQAAGIDQALFIWIAHDTMPRAMSAKVKGYAPTQSWFVDFTKPYIK